MRERQNWTLIGLVAALFGLPAIVAVHRWQVETPSDISIAIRELSILGLAAALLYLVVSRERLPLSSIGLRFDRPLRSLGWGLGLTATLFAAVIATLLVYGALGISYGEGQRIAPGMAATLLTVFRAGVAEEIFYRGFALERLQSLTGSKWIAAALPLLIFAGFHYRQGPAGIILALVLGAALTGFYLWKRDLLAAIIAHFLVDFIPNVAVPLVEAGA